ncbi:MAG: hypothetical protein IIZ74_06690, partial [Erysipelotrichaceae bacterium]|nr:hypothetical protein [Erysipelotrichaceae bacterium]
MTFTYNKDGTVKEISSSGKEYDSPFKAKSTFTYDSNGLVLTAKRVLDFEYSTWVCEDTYEYNGSNVSRIKTAFSRGGKGEAPNYFTDDVTELRYSGSQLREVQFSSTSDYCTWVDHQFFFEYEGNRISSFEYKYAGKGEEGVKVYYLYDGKPVNPVNTNPVELIETMPVTKEHNNIFISSLTLTFNYNISGINFDKANIYICDKETGLVAYKMPAELNPSTYIRSYQNKLTWVFPGSSSKKALTSGHTYYLKMDADFLSFEGTDKKISLGNDSNNPEWEFDIRTREDERIEGKFTFKRTDAGTGTAEFVYEKPFFTSNSSIYNSSLARLSMDVAIAAYNSDNRSNGSEYVTELFKRMKFEHIDHNTDYDGPTGDHTTGVCIASKPLNKTGTLIAIAVRGGGYGDEWAGNFTLGKGSVDHDGFSRGRTNVISFLKEFIEKYNITGDVTFWITGYSRASAIANLTAAYLDDGFSYNGVSYGKENVYAYCFEVPSSTTSSAAGSSMYNNIFNIVNPYDLVCRMPLMKWGFTRYGNVMMIPYQYCGSYYNDYKADALSLFNKYSGKNLESLPDAHMINDINKIMKAAGRVIVNRDLYYIFAQDGIASAARKYLGKGDIKMSDIPGVYLAVACILNVIDISGTFESIYDKLPIVGTINQLDKMLLAYNIVTERKQMLIPHYAELTLAWMELLEDTNILEKYEESSSTSENTQYAAIFVKVHCPVDVMAYQKGTGLVVGQIKGDEVTNYDNNPVLCWVDETGAKVFYIPAQYDVIFNLTATDNGTMTVTITAEDMLDGTVLRETSYENVELIKDQQNVMHLT